MSLSTPNRPNGGPTDLCGPPRAPTSEAQDSVASRVVWLIAGRHISSMRVGGHPS